MASRHPTAVIILQILIRIITFCLIILASDKILNLSLEILKDYLGYITPDTIFDINLADPLIAFLLVLPFWCGAMFGILGRKFDYAIIILCIAFSFFGYYGTETVTTKMYLGLVIAAILGSAIGFALKLLRQRFLPKLKV
jgi:hypothetical protein